MPDGGSYKFERAGRTTYVDGVTADGKSWSRVTTKRGNKILISGLEPDGTSFESETVTIGNKTTTTVIPSIGEPYEITCLGDECVEALYK